jgi:hypothetical protein
MASYRDGAGRNRGARLRETAPPKGLPKSTYSDCALFLPPHSCSPRPPATRPSTSQSNSRPLDKIIEIHNDDFYRCEHIVMAQGGVSEPSTAVDMRAVLDAADVEHPVVGECTECDSVVAAARDTPALEFEP